MVQTSHAATDKIKHIIEIILPILSFLKKLFILSWLCWVFGCMPAFFSCGERGYTLCVSFSLQWLLVAEYRL